MKHLITLVLLSILFIHCKTEQQINTITTQQLKELLSSHKIQLLDVRTAEEQKNGVIKNAIFADYLGEGFYQKASAQLNTNEPVYVYCRTGNRSGKASELLKEKGFEVFNVLGGYTKWKKENE